jgi:predicted nucleic acid-binding Zn ribbon protein
MSSSQILHSHCYPCGADVPKDVHDTVLRLVVSMNQERRTALHELYGHAKGIESLCEN